MKKNIIALLIILGIMGSMALGAWLLFKEDASINELSRITAYSKAELIFLKEQGFLDNIDSENMPNNKEQEIGRASCRERV